MTTFLFPPRSTQSVSMPHFQRSTSLSLFNRCSAMAVAQVLLAALLPVFESNARAGDITYNIVNYPVDQTDQWTAGTDTLSGTIITDGALGNQSTSSFIVGGTATITDPNGDSYTYPLNDMELGNMATYGCDLTADQILIPFGCSAVFNFGGPSINAVTSASTPGIFLAYTNYSTTSYGPSYYGGVWNDYENPAAWQQDNSAEILSGNPGDINASPGSSWIIAGVVPEPTTLTLLGSALLGLGVVYLRRRGAKGVTTAPS